MPNLMYTSPHTSTDNTFRIGAVIQLDGNTYRIIVQNQEYTAIIMMETTKYRILTYRSSVFILMIQMGRVKLISGQTASVNPVELMTEADKNIMNARVTAIEKLLGSIYPDYEVLQRRIVCPEFEEFKSDIGVGTTRAHALVRSYLQSGFDPYVLADRRKCRTRSQSKEIDFEDIIQKKRNGIELSKEELKAVFLNEVTEKFEGSRGQHLPLSSIYDTCISKYYSVPVKTQDGWSFILNPERPSYASTRRYVLAHTKLKGIRDGYISERDFRNNHRLLVGNAKYGVVGAGHTCEIDECATDFMLVSQTDRSQVAHRVVMYILIDVSTSTIIGCWADFQDNSIVGATNCFLTLCEEHSAQAAKYGVTVNDDIFPSCVFPQVLRCDHGAEYMSVEFKRFCMENRITLDPVTPGTGSLKSYVEQCFRQFHSLIKEASLNKGAITKDRASNHYYTACADINDARKICFEFVKWFNQHLRSDDYPLSVEQIKAGIPAIPYKLWNFESAVHDSPRRITEANRDAFLYSLMLTNESFRIGRRGIFCKGRYYHCDESWLNQRMLECGDKTYSIDCRYDPRTAGAVYMLIDKRLKRIPLAAKREEQSALADMTWAEANELYRLKRQTNAKFKEEDYCRKLAAKQAISDVFADAKRAQGGIAPRKAGMREATAQEKRDLAHENRIERKAQIPEQERPVGVLKELSSKTDKDWVIPMTDDDDNPFI